LKYLLFLFALLLTGSAFSQVPDTVVVYDYEYVTDTVWVERETFDLEKLSSVEPIALQANDPISVDFYSTLNSIDLTDNSNELLNMKRAGFFTVLLLAVQSTFAQPEFSVRAGLTQFHSRPNSYERSIFIGNHCGFDVKVPLAKSNIAFSVGVEQRGYLIALEYSISRSLISGTANIPLDKRIEKYRSFPVLVYYQFPRFEFFAGYEYKHVILNEQTEPSLSAYSWSEHGLVAGLEFNISPKLSLMGKLYSGGLFSVHDPATNRIVSRTNSSLSFKYYFNRK